MRFVARPKSLSETGIFLLCFSLLLGFFSFFRSISLLYFVPYLAVTILQSSFLPSLYAAFFVGCIWDSLYALPFGLFSLTYVFTTYVTYRIREVFFHDQAIHIAFFSTIYAAIFFLFFPLVHFLIEPDKSGIKMDVSLLIFCSFLNGLYTFCVCGPLLALEKKIIRIFQLLPIKKRR